MTTHTIRFIGGLALVGALIFGTAFAATITIVNNDGAGEGFNDATPVPPVGGNPGVTIGQQRLNVFQLAASIWGGILPSSVPIFVNSQFNPLTCTPTSAVLGSAGPTTIHRDFLNAPYPGTWYHQALANKLAGSDLAALNNDINATFNSALDGGACLGGLVWYYGYDGNEGVNVELLPVILHEMGHGLGFSTTTSGSSGNYNSGFPAIWDRYLLDVVNNLHWNQNSPAQRVASAISIDKLVWDGPAVTAAVPGFLIHRPRLVINAPGGIAGNYAANAAAFGAALTLAGVTGNVVLADDGTGTTSDACEALVNGVAIAGNVCLIDRGTCTFVSKVQKAQAAGAIAVLIANNVAGPLSPGGSDPSITIPVVGISQADGNTIKANLGLGVNVTVQLDPVQLAGADAANRALMYAPNPFQSGSSVSHYDVSMTPNALMEPAINQDLHINLDLTVPLFDDIGWFLGATATTLSRFTAEGRTDGIQVRWQFVDPSDVAVISLERADNVDGPYRAISTELSLDGPATVALDRSAEVGRAYFYQLSVTDRAGAVSHMGLATATRLAAGDGHAFLSAAAPNPTSNRTAVKFRIGRPEFVRLTVVDAFGRTVRTIHSGMLLAGEYLREWDGLSDGSRAASPGLYFITLRTSEGMKSQRVALVH